MCNSTEPHLNTVMNTLSSSMIIFGKLIAHVVLLFSESSSRISSKLNQVLEARVEAVMVNQKQKQLVDDSWHLRKPIGNSVFAKGQEGTRTLYTSVLGYYQTVSNHTSASVPNIGTTLPMELGSTVTTYLLSQRQLTQVQSYPAETVDASICRHRYINADDKPCGNQTKHSRLSRHAISVRAMQIVAN